MTEARTIRPDTALRRLVDLAVGIPLLVVVLPLFLVLGLLVRLDSRGPAFFVQSRVGRGGRLFPVLKFRTMVAGADRIGPAVSGRTDPRVTRLGRWLRASKLDELPQLIHVVRGEMTLLGPRAEVPRYVPHYTPEERLTLEVRPGLSGPGQVHFTRHQAAELDAAEDKERHYIDTQLHAKLALDLAYLRHRTLAADLALLASTAAVLLPRPGPGR